MKKALVILLHVGFWFCYFLIAMVILAVMFQTDGEPDEQRIGKGFEVILFFALIPSAISFYAYYLCLFPTFFKEKKYLKAISGGIFISLVAGFIGYICLYYTVGKEWCAPEDENGFEFGIVLFIAFIATIAGIVAWVIQGFVTWFEELKLKEDLRNKNQEMELALVKAKLDPHFLFNTINNIDILILKDGEKASQYLNELSDIMRFTLFETKADFIPLEKEIEYINKYIALQKIRTSNQDYVHFEVKGEIGQVNIAPMVLIPFVENAFKHTDNKKLASAIEIKIGVVNGVIYFTCINKYNPSRLDKENSNGIGNDLLIKRLNLIYPDSHKLEVSSENNEYSVSLEIQNDKI